MGGNILKWIGNWLQNREQRVVLNGAFSNWAKVGSGVPQGSVLGPLLFSVYINDLEENLNCKVLKFADDTKIMTSIASTDDNIRFQKNVDKITAAGDNIEMFYNYKKCKCMHLGRNNPQFNYTIDGNWLDCIDCEKDLGLNIDNKFKFSEHALISI